MKKILLTALLALPTIANSELFIFLDNFSDKEMYADIDIREEGVGWLKFSSDDSDDKLFKVNYDCNHFLVSFDGGKEFLTPKDDSPGYEALQLWCNVEARYKAGKLVGFLIPEKQNWVKLKNNMYINDSEEIESYDDGSVFFFVKNADEKAKNYVISHTMVNCKKGNYKEYDKAIYKNGQLDYISSPKIDLNGKLSIYSSEAHHADEYNRICSYLSEKLF